MPRLSWLHHDLKLEDKLIVYLTELGCPHRLVWLPTFHEDIGPPFHGLEYDVPETPGI